MAELESDEVGKQEGGANAEKCCPMCGRSGPTQAPTEMMRNMDPMVMMSKLPAVCMTFMVIVSALIAFGVGVIVGRGAHSR
jgi:hypothetical protein